MKLFKTIFLTLSLLVFSSCFDNLDFNRLNDYVIRPTITTSLTSFTLLPFQLFNDQGIQENTITYTSNFDFFRNEIVEDNVVKFDFYSEIQNEFDRNVTITISFLDENGVSIYDLSPIEVTSKDLNFSYLEEVEVKSNPDFKEVNSLKILAEIQDIGVQMDPLSDDEFRFKSSVTIYVETKL